MKSCLPLLAFGLLLAGFGRAAELDRQDKPLDYWLSQLRAADTKTRIEAARALGKMGPDAEMAVPALGELLRDKDETVRHCAAGALGKIGPAAELAIPGLIELLRDKQGNVRVVAAGALARMGPEAKAAIPALREMLRSEDLVVRLAARNALEKMGQRVLTAEMRPLVAGPATSERNPEAERLRGHWVAVSGEVDGRPLTKAELAGFAIDFEGSHLRRPGVMQIALTPSDPQEKPGQIDLSQTPFDFKLDTTKTLKEMNVEIGWSGEQVYTSSGWRRKGEPIFEKSIYSHEGDKLTICWGHKLRPKTFATKLGDGFSLVVYTRVKKAKD